jgi:hypothetical protein
MSLPSKTYAVRLPEPLAARFRTLIAEFDLQPSTVLKLLLKQQLEKSLEEQKAVVLSQIQKGKPVKIHRVENRMGNNSNHRIV